MKQVLIVLALMGAVLASAFHIDSNATAAPAPQVTGSFDCHSPFIDPAKMWFKQFVGNVPPFPGEWIFFTVPLEKDLVITQIDLHGIGHNQLELIRESSSGIDTPIRRELHEWSNVGQLRDIVNLRPGVPIYSGNMLKIINRTSSNIVFSATFFGYFVDK
jgi:hypothetical protein